MSRSSSNIIFSNLITQQNIIENLSNLQIINSNYIMNYHYPCCLSDFVKLTPKEEDRIINDRIILSNPQLYIIRFKYI